MTKDEIRAIALIKAQLFLVIGKVTESTLVDLMLGFLAAIAEKAEPVASVNTEALAFLKRNDDWIRARLPSNEATDTNLFTHLAIEPAPCTEDDKWNCKYCGKIKTCEAIKDSRNFGKPVGAPPLPDEVAQMVATLREMCWDECDSAAKMIERLARQLQEAKDWNAMLAGPDRLGIGHLDSPRTAEYVALANPTTILALISEREQQSQRIAELEQQRDELLAALEATVEAIRLFRNEPQLERLISLRATAGYVAMDAAMDRGTAAIAKVKP